MKEYFYKILTNPTSLVYFDSETLFKNHRDIAKSMWFLYPFYWCLKNGSFFILLSNLFSCFFFFEETVESLPKESNKDFKEFVYKVLFGSKLGLFIIAIGWFLFILKFGAFGLNPEDAIKNRKEHFNLQLTIMVVLFLIFVLVLYLLPDAESFFKTHKIK